MFCLQLGVAYMVSRWVRLIWFVDGCGLYGLQMGVAYMVCRWVWLIQFVDGCGLYGWIWVDGQIGLDKPLFVLVL